MATRRYNPRHNKPATVQDAFLMMANAMAGIKVGDTLPAYSAVYPTWDDTVGTRRRPKVSLPQLTCLAVVGEYDSGERRLENLQRAAFYMINGPSAEIVASEPYETYENEGYPELLVSVTNKWMSFRSEVAVQAFRAPTEYKRKELAMELAEDPVYNVIARTPRLAAFYGINVA